MPDQKTSKSTKGPTQVRELSPLLFYEYSFWRLPSNVGSNILEPILHTGHTIHFKLCPKLLVGVVNFNKFSSPASLCSQKIRSIWCHLQLWWVLTSHQKWFESICLHLWNINGIIGFLLGPFLQCVTKKLIENSPKLRRRLLFLSVVDFNCKFMKMCFVSMFYRRFNVKM